MAFRYFLVKMSFRNIILDIQHINTYPEIAFGKIARHPTFRCFNTICVVDRPLVRLQDLVPNVLYNVLCKHRDSNDFIILVLDNGLTVPSWADKCTDAQYVMSDGKKLKNVRPTPIIANMRQCFCQNTCRDCTCYTLREEANDNYPLNCECLTECKVITSNLDLTLQNIQNGLQVIIDYEDTFEEEESSDFYSSEDDCYYYYDDDYY